jgi:hypothetical protein
MRSQRRVRESEKLVLPAGNLEAFTEYFPESVIHLLIADFGIEEEVLAIFIAELEP